MLHPKILKFKSQNRVIKSGVIWSYSELFILVTEFLMKHTIVVLGDHLLYSEISLTIDDVVTWCSPRLQLVSSYHCVYLLFLVLFLHLTTFLSVLVAESDWINSCSMTVNGQFWTQIMHFKRMRLPLSIFLVVPIFQFFHTTVTF